MALTEKYSKTTYVGGGEGGGLMQRGMIHFAAAASTGELAVPGMSVIESAVFTPVAFVIDTAPDSDQRVFVNETGGAVTVATAGLPVPASGKITIAQEGASPVEMNYFYVIIGR